MLKRCILCHPPRVGLITVQDNTMLKLHVLHALRNKSLITVQDNTMLKPEQKH